MARFDLSTYYPIPLLPTEGYISLIGTLLEVAPKAPPEHVKFAMEYLSEALGEAEAGLVSRIDEDLSTGLERAFDILVDRVWVEFNRRLEFYAIFNMEGTAKFTEADRDEIDFDERVSQARVAATILDRIFGNGLQFLRGSFSTQATQMAARLDWLASKDLDHSVKDLLGEDFASLLEVCQKRYEAMVKERNSRVGKLSPDLRDIRESLRCQIYSYCAAVSTLYNPKKPETLEIVEAALLPILIARTQTRRKPSEGEAVGDEAGESELVDGELDEPIEDVEDEPSEEPSEQVVAG